VKRVGILGLPRSGKTTLFEILLQGAGSSSPAASGREQIGIVRVPDERVDRLSALFQPKKTTYAQIQFVDSAAAGRGSPRSAARGPDPFASVRDCDAIVAVVRDFDNPAVPQESGVQPDRDARALEDELVLNDLVIVETRIERIEKELKIGKRQGEREHALLVRCRERLEAGTPLRAQTFDADETKLLRGFQFLTRKPLLVVYNQDESSTREPARLGEHTLVARLRAHLEREIVALPVGDRDAYRTEMGVEEDGLSLIIRGCYELLGLISFFTVGPDEVRAWTLTRGETAVDAAGEIHTDLAKGFIRAEVVTAAALLEAGGTAGARGRGALRLEGREYVVQDGDCLEIRFNRT
jgi:GTP-binding protein YchF